MIIHVGKSKNCEYTTIGEAFAAVNADITEKLITVMIEAGEYNEKLVLSRGNVTVIGEDVDNTVIANGDYALMLDEEGDKFGTFRTATLRIDGDNITVKNLTIKNTAGNGKEHGQAVAVYAEGDKVVFVNCAMTACQDTLFTAPLPPKKQQKGTNGKGPKADCERRNGRQYYYKCYIRGDIDFIFGGATAFFEECDIFSQSGVIEDEAKLPEQDGIGQICGYVTAACTAMGQEFGYVFYHCNFLSDCPEDTIFLGRPWRDYAKTVMIECNLGKHIKKAGWYDWGRIEARDTVYYGEYRNTTEGVLTDISGRADWSHQIMEEDISKYKRENVLGDWASQI